MSQGMEPSDEAGVLYDKFYDYSRFSSERLENIMTGWDGLGGYHGLLIKKIASLIPSDSSVLDVGCGLCHLYEEVREKTRCYMGVDIDERVHGWAKQRYPNLGIFLKSVYDLSGLPVFDVVTAVGLYSDEPNEERGVTEMLNHARTKVVLTFFHKEDEGTPPFLDGLTWSRLTRIPHDIDKRLTIMEIYK